MSEVKPPTSASLRSRLEAERIVGLWNLCRFANSRFSMEARAWLVSEIAASLDSSRRAALGQAAEIGEGMAEVLRAIVAGDEVTLGRARVVLATWDREAAAIRALMEGE